MNNSAREGILMEAAKPESWAAVLRRDDLERARKAHPQLSVEGSLTAAGVRVRLPREDELPFQFDELLRQASLARVDGDWIAAAHLFQHIAAHHKNELWMKTMAARAFFEGGNHAEAGRLSREVNLERPTVDTLLLEAKVCRERRDYTAAIRLLERAEQWLEGDFYPVTTPKTDLRSIQQSIFGS
jgi:hypothetical protein